MKFFLAITCFFFATLSAQFSVTTDFLLWQAWENGLDYVIKNKGGVLIVNDGKMIYPNFKWSPGFRLGFGYDLPCDGWDVETRWTYFHTTASSVASRPPGGAVYSTWIDPNILDLPSPAEVNVFSADCDWRLNLNQIDLLLGRECAISPCFFLRPHFGLRTAWVYQKDIINYFGATIFDVPVHYLEDLSNNFWGIGFVGGLNSQWNLGRGWSLYGDIDGAILAGWFNVQQQQTELISHSHQLHIKKKLLLSEPILDLALGIRWQTCLGCENQYALLIQAGWEQHIYFSQNQLCHFVSDGLSSTGRSYSNLGDLSLQGFTLSAKLGF